MILLYIIYFVVFKLLCGYFKTVSLEQFGIDDLRIVHGFTQSTTVVFFFFFK